MPLPFTGRDVRSEGQWGGAVGRPAESALLLPGKHDGDAGADGGR